MRQVCDRTVVDLMDDFLIDAHCQHHASRAPKRACFMPGIPHAINTFWSFLKTVDKSEPLYLGEVGEGVHITRRRMFLCRFCTPKKARRKHEVGFVDWLSRAIKVQSRIMGIRNIFHASIVFIEGRKAARTDIDPCLMPHYCARVFAASLGPMDVLDSRTERLEPQFPERHRNRRGGCSIFFLSFGILPPIGFENLNLAKNIRT